MAAIATWRGHLSEGRLMLQRSAADGRVFFYPRIMTPGSGEPDPEWVEASGRGTVYATTVVRKKDPSENYNVALIDLEEGPRMMSRVEGIAPEAVEIGMAVQAEIRRGEDDMLVVFRPR
nr:OB-fold domain-containing protein [uncultured Brevundimonas sp.]